MSLKEALLLVGDNLVKSPIRRLSGEFGPNRAEAHVAGQASVQGRVAINFAEAKRMTSK